MAAIVGTATGAVASLVFGRFDEAMMVAALLAVASFRFRWFTVCSAFMLVTTLGSVAYAGGTVSYSFIVPAVAVYCLRTAGAIRAAPGGIWLIILPIVAFMWRLQDYDIITAVTVALGITLPVPALASWTAMAKSPWVRRAEVVCCAGILVWAAMMTQNWYALLCRTGQVGIIDGGEWARSDTPVTKTSKLNIGVMYSYSELRDLLAAKAISYGELDGRIVEAWLITPTRPISHDNVESLLAWVKEGGHLIVVTDHTDVFGHAAVTNALLRPIRLRTSSTAFFPDQLDITADVTLGRSVWLKTANTQSGWYLWPQVTARWTEERADYSGENFFGSLRASRDDHYGRRVISGSRAVGKGTVTLFGDSTVFANFAIYQPGVVPLAERLRCASIMAHVLMPILVGALGGILWLLVSGRWTILTTTAFLGVLAVGEAASERVNWGQFEWWAGDARMLMEWSAPDESISTAFAVVPMTGIKPRWHHGESLPDHGIWVSCEPPPRDGWRWISPERQRPAQTDVRQGIEQLIAKLNTRPPSMWRRDVAGVATLNVGDLWTNAAVGDWWFDRGISKAKATRLNAWLAWLQGTPLPLHPQPIEVGQTRMAYELKLLGMPPETFDLPQINIPTTGEAYLGGGVSAEVVEVDGEVLLMGGKTFTEGWDVPSGWVLRRSTGGSHHD